MSDSQGILLFTTGSQGGGSSSEYDKAAFQDIDLPASNNTGYTSTVSTNPLNGYFANDLAPKWMAKTLWIKDLIRVEDRTLWINGRATYRIVWNENFPGADGYVFGSVQLSGTSESRYVAINDIADGCGVTGVIRRCQWILRPKSGTATATPSIDGSNLTQIDFGGYTGLGNSFATTKPVYNAYTTEAANATRDIHDHRLTADQSNKLEIVGCVVYFNVTGDGIDAFGGTGFVDKVITTPSGTTLAYPSGVSNFLGGVDSVFVNSNGVFGITSSPTPGVGSNCSGASGTALLNVSIGTGASFPIGTGLLIPNGASYYIGQVTNVSGDVLTVSPAFAVGVSNVVSALFNAGASFAINQTTMEQAFSFQPGVDVRLPLGVSGIASEAPYSFSDPALRYRAWGSTLRLVAGASLSSGLSGQTLGLLLPANTDFLQFEGRFSALEFEFIAGQSALLSATLAIDGMYAAALSVPLSGPTVYRRSVFANGANSFHSVRLAETGSTNVLLSRITAYRPKTYNGPSYGLLAEIPTGITFLTRNAQNASLMAFGNITRVYSESLRCNGASWGSTATLTAPGGRCLTTIATDDYVDFQYFGTQFSILGFPGTSGLLFVNGASTAYTFNTWMGTGLTLGFHSLRYQHKAGTSLNIGAIDFLSPYHQVRNKQQFDSTPNLSITPRFWAQTSEPLNARNGDIWEQNVQNQIAYQRIMGGWQRVAIPPIGPTLIGVLSRGNLPSVGQQISASSGSYQANSAGYTLITNLGVTLTTTGRPVFLMLQAADGAAGGNIGLLRGSDNASVDFGFYRDGSIISNSRMTTIASGAAGVEIRTPASALQFVDVVAAGTYSYQVRARSNAGDILAAQVVLVAREL